MNIKRTIILLNILALSLACMLFTSCKGKSMNGMLIITQVKGDIQNLNFITGEDWRYTPEAQLALLDPNKPASLKVLTHDFYSACSPEISFDGKYMLFAAQKKNGTPWQIWEMNLENLKTKQITSSSENCIDPAYLPGGRLVFSKLTANDSLKAGHSLFTCNLDGSDIKRITFNPHSYFASNVLNDGRILTITRQLYPYQGNPFFVILRPDGTKAELFYKGPDSGILSGCGWETMNGKIIFVESDNENKGNLISIKYNRPLHTRVNLTSEIKGDFHSVFPQYSGKLLVSYRHSEANRYALYGFDPENKILGQAIYSNADYNVLGAVVVEEHNRPRKLPSEVDLHVKTGLLLCQDINIPDPQTLKNVPSRKKAGKIEVLGLNSSLGIVQVEEDGSFYLKAMADTPFRIQTLDENGKVLNESCAWIWLRPNERRGCVGCHEVNELVPENRVPLSVKKPPVIIPVHIDKIKEKTVELE